MTTVTEARTMTPRFLWLDLTLKCQLRCTHCYNSSGPDGTHGAMPRDGWISVLDQAARLGVRSVQFIGGGATRGRVQRVNSQIGDRFCRMRSS